jgi:phosphate transport system substrate-binding protein
VTTSPCPSTTPPRRQIVCSGGNGDLGALLKSFLGYTATDGQASLEDLGAAPLPAEIQEKVIASVSTIS